MPEQQASPAALALQDPSLQRKLYGQRPSQDGCYQPALAQPHKELRLEARGLSKDLSARREEIHSQRLDALRAGEPAPPSKCEDRPSVSSNGPQQIHGQSVGCTL